MRLVKINYRNPALDTEFSYCINNYLWRKDKVQILSDKEMLVPKYYKARHVGQLDAQRRANARYQARKPLKLIKKAHETKQRKKAKQRKRTGKTDKVYLFKVHVNPAEYKMLWNFLYKEVRNPLEDNRRVQTIEELMEKQERRQQEKQ